MKKEIIYSANVCGGDFDGFWHNTKFVSENKELVEKWVEKYNRILKAYKEFYSKFETEDAASGKWIGKEFEEYDDRWYKMREIREAYIGEIEIRK